MTYFSQYRIRIGNYNDLSKESTDIDYSEQGAYYIFDESYLKNKNFEYDDALHTYTYEASYMFSYLMEEYEAARHEISKDKIESILENFDNSVNTGADVSFENSYGDKYESSKADIVKSYMREWIQTQSEKIELSKLEDFDNYM